MFWVSQTNFLQLLEEPSYNCPKYIRYYNNYLNSSEYTVYNNKYKDLYDYITLSTGWLANGPQKVYYVYFALASQVRNQEILGQDFSAPKWLR